jgi:Cilia- and flagella-associated protein 54
MNLAVEHVSLYWLVYNSALATVRLARHLLAGNQSKCALPHLIHAVLAMESHTPLRDPHFLLFRCSIVATACAVYTDLKQTDLTLKLADHMLHQVTETQRLLALDPVPQPLEVQRIFMNAVGQLQCIKLPLELAISLSVADVTAKLTRALISDQQRAVVLVDALSSGVRQCVWRRTLDSKQKPLFEALRALLLPRADAALKSVESFAQRVESAMHDADGDEEDARATEEPAGA